MSDIDGTYGGKSTFEDARVTVTKFLDDFYGESSDNYNQSFLNLERRLQEYFGYKHKPLDSGKGDAEAAVWPCDGERNVTVEKSIGE